MDGHLIFGLVVIVLVIVAFVLYLLGMRKIARVIVFSLAVIIFGGIFLLMAFLLYYLR